MSIDPFLQQPFSGNFWGLYFFKKNIDFAKIFQKVRKCFFRKLTDSVNIRRSKDNVKLLFRH